MISMAIMAHQGAAASLRVIKLSAWKAIVKQKHHPRLETVRHTFDPGLGVEIDLRSIAGCQIKRVHALVKGLVRGFFVPHKIFAVASNAKLLNALFVDAETVNGHGIK